MNAVLGRIDTTVMSGIGRVVWFIERTFGTSHWEQARWVFAASAALNVIWVVACEWTAKMDFGDVILIVASTPWLILCWLRITILRRKERILSRRPDVQAWYSNTNALVRVCSLAIFGVMGSTSIASDLAHHNSTVRDALYAIGGMYGLMYAIAMYIEDMPPAPPRTENRRDWFAFLRPSPVPA